MLESLSVGCVIGEEDGCPGIRTRDYWMLRHGFRAVPTRTQPAFPCGLKNEGVIRYGYWKGVLGDVNQVVLIRAPRNVVGFEVCDGSGWHWTWCCGRLPAGKFRQRQPGWRRKLYCTFVHIRQVDGRATSATRTGSGSGTAVLAKPQQIR